MRNIVYLLVDMYLRLFAKTSGKEIKSSTGKICLVKSKGQYGLWLHDYVQDISDFVWFNSKFDRVAWRAVIYDAAFGNNVIRYIGIRRHPISCKRKGDTLTITVGKCVIAFPIIQRDRLLSLLDTLDLE